MENQGSRRFAAARSFGINSNAEALAAGDVDADGSIDLVVGHGTVVGGDVVTVLANDGAAQFSSVAAIGAAGDPRAVALVDLDGDADLDLAVASGSADLVRLYSNDAGTFDERARVVVGDTPFAIAFANIDGRCGVDLVAANKRSTDLTWSSIAGSGEPRSGPGARERSRTRPQRPRPRELRRVAKPSALRLPFEFPSSAACFPSSAAPSSTAPCSTDRSALRALFAKR